MRYEDYTNQEKAQEAQDILDEINELIENLKDLYLSFEDHYTTDWPYSSGDYEEMAEVIIDREDEDDEDDEDDEY